MGEIERDTLWDMIFATKNKREPTPEERAAAKAVADKQRESYKERFGFYPEDDPGNPLGALMRAFRKSSEKKDPPNDP